MDKYEFNIKVEQIKKLVTKGDFTTSMKIADTIDWRRVRNANLLAMISQVYEKNGEYQEAKEILMQAYERAPIGKRLLFKLAELALREGNVREAEEYYREFVDVAPGDARQNLLRYLILKAKGASSRQLIAALEKYVSTELDERWMYELAELYASVGEKAMCVQMCDKITLMFAFGKYVDKALDLKARYAELSDYQQDLVEHPDKYEAQYKAVEQEFENGGLDVFGDEDERNAGGAYSTEMQFPDHDYQEAGRYEEDRYTDGADAEEAGYADGSYAEENGYADNGSYAEEDGYADDGSYAQENGYTDDSYEGDGGYADGSYEEENGYADGGYTDDGGVEGDSYAGEEINAPQGYASEYAGHGQAGSDEEDGYGRSADGPERYGQPAEDPDGSGRDEEPEEEYVRTDRPSRHSTLDEELVANLHQAAAEEELAREMSRIAGEPEQEPAADGPTKKLYNINRALPRTLQPGAEEAQVVEDDSVEAGFEQEADGENEAESVAGDDEESRAADRYAQEPSAEAGADSVPRFMVIETRTPEKGMEKAIERLKAYHIQNNSHNQTVKIAGGKLNSRGIENVAPMLAGRDLIVDEAGDLSGSELEKLSRLIAEDVSGMVVVLLDNPRQIGDLYQNNAKQLEAFVRIDGETETVISSYSPAPADEAETAEEEGPEVFTEVSDPDREVNIETEPEEPERSEDYQVEMDPNDFAQYACDYAAEIDCSITGKSMLALYERVELMEEDGIPLTKENAEAMIEEAADKAEKPSLGRLITGVFSAKYDKEGLLILREEHFI